MYVVLQKDILDARTVFEIVIGGWTNTQSVIRDAMGAEPLRTRDTPNILSCGEFRTFWIHWAYVDLCYYLLWDERQMYTHIFMNALCCGYI